jgi:CRP-like cAMP-binding protein
MTNPLVLKLERRDRSLSEQERAVLDRAVDRVMIVEAGQDMVREHDRPTHSTLLLEGWAHRYMLLPSGRRQILALHIGGDFLDLHSFPLKVMDHSVAALTRCKVSLVPHEALQEITQTQPHLTRLLWLSTLIDAAILRQWLLGVGQRSAIERAAHLLCEMRARLAVIEGDGARGFDLPLTQGDLADALGISAVHTNRTLQTLRARGLVTWRGAAVEILDWDALAALAAFDPTYLNLHSERR